MPEHPKPLPEWPVRTIGVLSTVDPALYAIPIDEDKQRALRERVAALREVAAVPAYPGIAVAPPEGSSAPW